jgi:hypothetical protein
MTGAVGKSMGSDPHAAVQHPDTLEVAPGTEHENLEGWIPQLASEEEIRIALEKAFDYRGDVCMTLKNGHKIQGYVFDRRSGKTLADSCVRIFPAGSEQKLSVAYADIAALAFTGKDPAAGKSYEAWVRKYWEKRMAGEKSIGNAAETLD